jgi:hypothetical protein
MAIAQQPKCKPYRLSRAIQLVFEIKQFIVPTGGKVRP